MPDDTICGKEFRKKLSAAQQDPENTVVLTDLPTKIRGFICLGEDYTPCIFINSRLSKEQQWRTYAHEMKHLVSGELYDEGYVEYE